MSTTTTTISATTPGTAIKLSPECLGLGRVSKTNPEGTLERANELLQKNHDEYHIFWRDVGGHNHLPHTILSVYALGGGPAEVQRAFDDGVGVQRAIPALDKSTVEGLKDPATFLKHIGDLSQYTNYLAFFENEIAAKGWRDVIQEYVFSGTESAEVIFAQLYEGAHHPIIHLGFGVEFELPSIVAEGLAQAAVHDSASIGRFFAESEKEAATKTGPGKSLLSLYDEVRATEKIATAARLPDGPVRVRDGVMGRAGQEMISLAAQYRLAHDEQSLERGTAEMINLAAYSAGAAQRSGKARKIDFFHMHNVNASIFFTAFNRQPWIKLADKVRLVERKARLDLVWFAACAAPALQPADITSYQPSFSNGMGWEQLYAAINVAHDDGHVAKFARAIKNGEEVSRPFESGPGSENFPVRGDSWLKLAQMAYDTTLNQGVDDKWIWGAGFAPLWNKIPAQ